MVLFVDTSVPCVKKVIFFTPIIKICVKKNISIELIHLNRQGLVIIYKWIGFFTE